MTALRGVLVIDKGRGPTSHDVVARLRRALCTRDVGHAGTLDPIATGVLVALVGEATKLAPYLTAEDKEYEATLSLGVETDTLDAQGKTTRSVPVDESVLRSALLARAIEAERVRVWQVPPAYSAIHVGGERAHVRARRGERALLAPRPVAVKSLEVLAFGLGPAPWITVRACVSKGYFVRSFARDFAEALGTVGHLTALRRTRSGSFTLDEAVTVHAPDEELRARLLPLGAAASRALPVARLSEAGARDARFGRAVRAADLDARGTGLFAWLDANAALVAVGDVGTDGGGRVVRGFGE
jgi:tRNA pseudouridine55 synthase